METFKRILSFARPYGRKIPGYLLLSVLSVVFGVVNYALLGPLLTVLFDNQEAAAAVARPDFAPTVDYATEWFRWLLSSVIRDDGVVRGLLLVCGAIVVACLLANVCRYLSQRIIVGVETRLMQNIRGALFSKILSLPVGWFTARRKGDVLSSISNDVAEVQSSVAGSFHVFLREPLLVIGFLAMLIYMSPQLTLVSLVTLPVSAFIVTRITRRLRAGSVETQRLMGRILSHFEEAISGSRIIKAFGARRYAEQSFDTENRKHRETLRQVRNRQELASPVSEFLGISIAAGVLFYGGWLNFHGNLGMTWQQFIVYIMFYWKVLEPAKTIAKQYALVQKGLVSAERIFHILDELSGIPDGTLPVTEFREAVTFDHVTFAYEDTAVLRDVCLTLPKGKTVAVVGPSGAGKSTMADLLPRFYDVQEGCIRIDGTDIRSLRLGDLTRLMGIVTQETILFNDTVFNNIAFGMSSVTREQVAAAARVANADGFIEALPQGYDTNIGDRGAKLSGGQRQRIAITRAVLKNPPILILDEATSALDTESERLVQDALTRLMGGRTSLVIAHRLSTVRGADEIYVLQDGRVVEHGNHKDLVANHGLYSHLCSLQDFS
ncbi:MAG: ATP-binding cassette domain-containing protein [Bacteroidales bacterium]|nr:ATP-binding cassette domain-containing protein [Bacteroidales bacterium]